MENDLLKDVKNIRTISRLVFVDETYQDIYCQENLSFIQMLLLCQMAMFGFPKEKLQELVEKSASVDEIKQNFREQIMSEAFSEFTEEQKNSRKNDENVKNLLEDLAQESKNVMCTLIRFGKESSEREKEVIQNQEIFVQKLDEIFKRSETESGQVKKDFLAVLDRKFEERRYSLMEKTTWKKLKDNLGRYDTKRLSLILRALDAGIQPSKLMPYLENLSVEQFELIVCILTREVTEGGKEYGK